MHPALGRHCGSRDRITRTAFCDLPDNEFIFNESDVNTASRLNNQHAKFESCGHIFDDDAVRRGDVGVSTCVRRLHPEAVIRDSGHDVIGGEDGLAIVR